MIAKIILAFVACISLSTPVFAKLIVARCVSESGRSIYDLELDTERQSGEIRYRFMGQDTFYDVTLNSKDQKFITGVASFKSALSGETKGNPFAFTYDANTNLFTELNIKAQCSVLR